VDRATIENEWQILAGLLPAGWRDLARSMGALRRSRKVRDADTLLRVILLHVGAGLSLRQASARAKRAGLASLSDVAILKRLRGAGPWLQALAERMYLDSPLRRPLGELPSGRRIRVVDASSVSEPGSTGTDWRIHFVLQLPSLVCDFFEVTAPSGGESYNRLTVRTGDIILGDRGYCHREGVAHVVGEGGDVIVRLNMGGFPLVGEDGAPLDFLGALRSLSTHTPGEWPVTFSAGGKEFSGRLCAIRKSDTAAQEAKAKLLRVASRKGKKVRPSTLEAAEYIFVFATLDRQYLSTEGVLDLYRARWQVELVFKRIKSLLSVGHLPKHDAESARAWIHAKLLTVLLIERLSQEARFFSPWGFQLQAS
jgi:hypothetical protein